MGGKFKSVHAASSQIEGMLSEFSMAAMDSLLQLQADHSVGGHSVEFGVYRGRSLAVLAHHAQPGEILLGVDVAEYIDRPPLLAIAPQLQFFQSSSETFKKSYNRYRDLKHQTKVVHVNSSHFFNTTLTELEMSEELIGPRGIVILDDFTNLDYSQILAATFKYLFTRRSDLSVFLVTSEKAYLCRKSDFDFFGAFVLNGLVNAMAERGQPNICASRTDMNSEYRAFCLRARLPGEQDTVYGRELYQQYLRKP